VDQEIIDKLLKLNHKFYQTFAKPFSSTRQRLQPGVQQILKQIPQAANILDLGCGNGEVWCRLISGGYHGDYVGIDSSRDLLNTIPSNYIGTQQLVILLLTSSSPSHFYTTYLIMDYGVIC
jgi:ubiquinone/menaquinone biosynthesis C-methylase UbiE